jgi:hypothetical protein
MLLQPPKLKRRLRRNERLYARTRQDLVERICTVVLDIAPNWCEEDRAVIVITNPRLSRADVQSVFDMVDEKYHLVGIELRFDQPDGEPLRAIFTQPERKERA